MLKYTMLQSGNHYQLPPPPPPPPHLQSLEVECMALEPKLHEVKASYDLLVDLSQAEDGVSVWEGEDEALHSKEEAEKRYQELLDKLRDKKELLNAELSKYVKE